jgi:tetratricopeptide (TPR) repeat protein
MEACWLLALVLSPLFFNIYSSRVFEPDKIALVRSLALIAGAAWLIKLLSEGGLRFTIPLPASRYGPLAGFYRLPLVTPVLAFIAIYIVSTIFSVSPHATLLGSYQRMQGTFSTFSYVLLFAAVAANLRRRAQVERILTTVILTSLPISVYGLLQRFQRDPLPWGGDTINRITSNMGNAIFVGAYLIMAFMLGLGRVVRVFRAILSDDDSSQIAPHVIRAASYIFILAVNALAIYFTFSRGPWLGLFAGIYIFILCALIVLRQQAEDRSALKPLEMAQALGFAIVSIPVGALPAYGIVAALKRGWRWLWLSWVFTALIGAGILILFNIPNGPLERYRQIPGLSRIGQMLDEIEGKSGTGRVRVLIWGGVIQLMTPHAPLEYPDGSLDRWNALRPFVGYGPEGLYVAFNPFYPPELAQLEARNATPDRSHNETFDALVNTGLIGLVVHFGFWVAVFYYSLKWLGLVGSRTRQIVFLILVLGGGLAGAAGMVLWQGPEFFGVGLPTGMVLGLIIFLTLTALRSGESAAKLETWRAITLISLFAAIVAHFVEIHFGIAIASTRTHFWIFAGLMLVVGYALPAHAALRETGKSSAAIAAEPAKAQSRRKLRAQSRGASADSEAWGHGLTSAGLVAALLITLGYDFITNATRTTNPIEILSKSLTYLPLKQETSPAILWLLLGAWLMAGAVAYLEEARRGSTGRFKPEALGGALAVSLGVSAFVWMVFASQLASIAAPFTQQPTLQQVVGSAERVTGVLVIFYVLMFLLTLGWAALLMREVPAPPARAAGASQHPLALAGYFVLPFVAVVAAVMLNLRVIQADTVYKSGLQLDNEGNPQVSTEIYKRAIELAPGEDYYYLFLGRAILNLTGAEQDAAKRQALLVQAESELEIAQRLNPLNPDHTANLARLNRQWAFLVNDPEQKAKHAQAANDYYDRVTHISKNSALLYNEWARLAFDLLEDAELAHAKINKSLELDDNWEQTYLYAGDLYAWEARRSGDPAAKSSFWAQAIDAYRRGIEIAERKQQSAAQLRLNMATLYADNLQFSEAIAALQPLTTANDPGLAKWQVYQQIGAWYAQMGDIGNAIASLEAILSLNDPNVTAWQIYQQIGQLHLQVGDKANALVKLQEAYRLAPDDNARNQIQPYLAAAQS